MLEMLLDHSVPIRKLASLICLIVITFSAIFILLLHYRNMKRVKIGSLKRIPAMIQ